MYRRTGILKADVSSVSSSSELLESLYGGQFTFINSVDETKFLCTTPPPTQHHSFFRNYPLYLKVEALPFFVARIVEGEVFLVWDGGDKMKSQKDLAKGAKLGVKDDIKIIDYYRCVFMLL